MVCIKMLTFEKRITFILIVSSMKKQCICSNNWPFLFSAFQRAWRYIALSFLKTHLLFMLSQINTSKKTPCRLVHWEQTISFICHPCSRKIRGYQKRQRNLVLWLVKYSLLSSYHLLKRVVNFKRGSSSSDSCIFKLILKGMYLSVCRIELKFKIQFSHLICIDYSGHIYRQATFWAKSLTYDLEQPLTLIEWYCFTLAVIKLFCLV